MNVERGANGRFTIVSCAVRLALPRSKYEDIFYCLPLDSGTLYRQMNDTVCDTTELRDAFKQLVADAGGVQPAMAALQEAVQAVSPEQT